MVCDLDPSLFSSRLRHSAGWSDRPTTEFGARAVQAPQVNQRLPAHRGSQRPQFSLSTIAGRSQPPCQGHSDSSLKGPTWRETAASCQRPAPASSNVSQSSRKHILGQIRGRSGLAPPAARGVILENGDRVPCRAPCMEPASPSACGRGSLLLPLTLFLCAL